MSKILYTRCSCCEKPIPKDSECYIDEMCTGIFCSLVCWARTYGRARRIKLTQQALENNISINNESAQFEEGENNED